MHVKNTFCLKLHLDPEDTVMDLKFLASSQLKTAAEYLRAFNGVCCALRCVALRCVVLQSRVCAILLRCCDMIGRPGKDFLQPFSDAKLMSELGPNPVVKVSGLAWLGLPIML